jgi:hypothetical protein
LIPGQLSNRAELDSYWRNKEGKQKQKKNVNCIELAIAFSLFENK